uniref:(northern house mosquito) hypothetical protein n=1 Tax=Culex pipiens TaxID=7175 RepID=A0A8D8F3S4_CULPI
MSLWQKRRNLRNRYHHYLQRMKLLLQETLQPTNQAQQMLGIIQISRMQKLSRVFVANVKWCSNIAAKRKCVFPVNQKDKKLIKVLKEPILRKILLKLMTKRRIIR